MNHYDATKEFSPFVVSSESNGKHPRSRVGSTRKRRDKMEERRIAAAKAPAAPEKKKK